MSQRSPATSLRLLVLAAVLAVGLSMGASAQAADPAIEHADLATILRELTLIDHLALQAQAAAAGDTRYHFDYARLSADIARVRAGINDYLTPPRAQPRDPLVLSGNYSREGTSP